MLPDFTPLSARFQTTAKQPFNQQTPTLASETLPSSLNLGKLVGLTAYTGAMLTLLASSDPEIREKGVCMALAFLAGTISHCKFKN